MFAWLVRSWRGISRQYRDTSSKKIRTGVLPHRLTYRNKNGPKSHKALNQTKNRYMVWNGKEAVITPVGDVCLFVF